MLVFLSEFNLFIKYLIRVENYKIIVYSPRKSTSLCFIIGRKKPNNTIASRRRVFQQSATKTALESLKLQNGEFSISTINMLFIF